MHNLMISLDVSIKQSILQIVAAPFFSSSIKVCRLKAFYHRHLNKKKVLLSSSNYIISNESFIETMEDDYMFQCPICCVSFGQERQPMLICISQHTACQACVELLFKDKDKQTMTIDCHMCRKQVRYNNISPFYWLKDLIKTKKDLQVQGSQIRRLNGALTKDLSKLNQELKKEREKVEWLMEMRDKQRQHLSISEEKVSYLIANALQDYKKEDKAEKLANQGRAFAKIEDLWLKCQEAIKKQIQMKSNDQIINMNQGRIQVKGFSDLVKKKMQSLQVQNKSLKKEVCDLKKILGQFSEKNTKMMNELSRQIKVIQVQAKKEESREKQPVPDEKNKKIEKTATREEKYNEKINQLQERSHKKTDNMSIKPSPFIKKASEPAVIEPTKAMLADVSLKSAANKEKVSQKAPVQSQTKIQRRRERLYTMPSLKDLNNDQKRYKNEDVKNLKMKIKPLDFQPLQLDRFSNKENVGLQSARDIGRYNKQNLFPPPYRKQSMKQINKNQLQKEISFQTQKCQRIATKLKSIYCKATQISTKQLMNFIDHSIHLDQQEILINFTSAKFQ